MSTHASRSSIEPRASLGARLGEALLWALLVSPFVIALIVLRNDVRIDRLTLLSAGLCVLWVLALRSIPLRPRTLHLMLLPLVVLAGVEWAMLARFHTRLNSSYLNVAWINLHQYPEFLSTFGWRIGGLLGIVLAIWFVGWRAIRHRPSVRRTKTLLASLVALAIYYVGGTLWYLQKGSDLDEALVDMATREQSAPLGVLFQAGSAAHNLRAWADLRHRRQANPVQARARDDAADVVVFYLGESVRAENWQLFGYERDTTPGLAALAKTGAIIPFKGWANSPHTWLSVSSLLSLMPMAEMEKMLGTPSLIGYFAAAGYDVHWISTQKIDGFAGPIGEIAAETGGPRFFANAWDEKLDEELRKLLDTPSAAGKRRFIVLHGKGNHFDYSRRYPATWQKWTPAGGAARDAIVNGYDNALRYTDDVIRRVVGTLEGSGRRAVMLYVSDHGESLLDDDKQLLGHAVGNRYDLSVPGFFWASSAMRRDVAVDRTLDVGRARVGGDLAQRRVMNSDLSHSLLHLAGVTSPHHDPQRSIFEPGYQAKDRWVIAHGAKQAVEHYVEPKAATAP